VPLKDAARITFDALWGLFTLVIILGGILGGVFTAIEAGAVACIWAFFVTMFIYRDYRWRQLMRFDYTPDDCYRFHQAVERVRPYVGWDRLAVARDDQGYHYAFTFAGWAMNSVIAAWAGAGAVEIGNVVLRTEEPIDFSSLPADPWRLRHIAARTTRILENLTAFQMALPPEFIERELADVWVKTPVFARSLARLRTARLVPAQLADVAELCI